MIKEIIKGDVFEFAYNVSVEAGHVVRFSLRGVVDFDKDFVDGNISLTVEETLTLGAGLNNAYISLISVGSGIRKVVYNEVVSILDDPLAQTTDLKDLRDFDQYLLDAVEAYIKKMADNDQIDHLKAALNTDSLERIGITKLYDFRNRLKLKVSVRKGTLPKSISYGFCK